MGIDDGISEGLDDGNDVGSFDGNSLRKPLGSTM